MSESKDQKPNDAHVIAGGEDVGINYNGRVAKAFVRQVKPSELTEYLRRETEGDDAVLRMVASVGGEVIDLDAIDLDSYEALIEADKRQNFTHARRKEEREAARVSRQVAMLREYDPGACQRLEAAQVEAMESLLSSLAPSASEQGAGVKSSQ